MAKRHLAPSGGLGDLGIMDDRKAVLVSSSPTQGMCCYFF